MKEDKSIKAFHPSLQGRNPSDVDAQLASQRTGLSFQRTRLSADRTLMAVIRTALSLISFGFTIFQFFQHEKNHFKEHVHSLAPRYFGFALTFLGIGILIMGISYHLKLMRQVREEREALKQDHLLPTIDKFPVSMTLITALLLLLLGVVALTTMFLQFHGFRI